MRKTFLLEALGVLAFAIALLFAPASANAQRPSLGGLQLQINDILSGDLSFDRLSFGPECFIQPDPDLGALCFSDLRFIFKLPPGFPGQPTVDIPGGLLRFGDECTIGVDPTGELTGLIERDPNGLRLLGQNGQGCRLTFGPTDDCRIFVDPDGPPGLTEQDPFGFRLLGIPDPDFPDLPPQGAVLRFGPTDDCSLGIVPGLTGLVESDPGGLRLLGPDGQGCILTFGPTDDCRIRIDPSPNGPRGLILEDPFGARLLGVPDPQGLPQGAVLRFGPTDECSLGIDPNFTGLVERDPGGLRLLGRDGEGCILTFGPTDECRILVDPARGGLVVEEENILTFETPLILMEGTGEVNAPGTTFRAAVFEGGFQGRFARRSSAAYKENVREIDNALEKVKQLRGVYFDWKKEFQTAGKGADIGFIAEEVAEVISEVVVYDQDTKKPAAVEYDSLVSVVVEAVKEQQQQIESQAKEIASQQAQIDSQQTQIDDQQTLIDDQQAAIVELQNAVAELRAMQK